MSATIDTPHTSFLERGDKLGRGSDWIPTNMGYIKYSDITRFRTVQAHQLDWDVELWVGTNRHTLLRRWVTEGEAKQVIEELITSCGEGVFYLV